MIKKTIIVGVLVLALIIGVASASQVFLYGENRNIGITIFTTIPQAMSNYLENLPSVNEVRIYDGDTIILTNLNTTDNLDTLERKTDLLEHKVIDNKANILTIAGSPPMPICMRDRVTGELYGIYVDDGRITLNGGDILCVS